SGASHHRHTACPVELDLSPRALRGDRLCSHSVGKVLSVTVPVLRVARSKLPHPHPNALHRACCRASQHVASGCLRKVVSQRPLQFLEALEIDLHAALVAVASIKPLLGVSGARPVMSQFAPSNAIRSRIVSPSVVRLASIWNVALC